MKSNTIEHQYIAPLIKEGVIKILPEKYCFEFDDYVTNNLAWSDYSPYKLDWNKIGANKQFDWSDASSDDLINFLRDTPLKKYSHLGIIYGSNEPGVMAPFNTIIQYLESLSAHTALVLFIVGVEINKYGVVNVVNEDFAEMDVYKLLLTSFLIE